MSSQINNFRFENILCLNICDECLKKNGKRKANCEYELGSRESFTFNPEYHPLTTEYTEDEKITENTNTGYCKLI